MSLINIALLSFVADYLVRSILDRSNVFDFVILAYCKNPVTEKWFCYDDHLVSELDPSRVCTPDAYILFYRCRDTPLSPSSEPNTVQISPSQLQSRSQLPPPERQIDLAVKSFDEPLNLYSSSSSSIQPSIVRDNVILSTTKDKQHHYTLQPPLPLPRKLVTPLSSSPSQDEFSFVPAIPYPIPRARKSQYETEIDSLSTQLTSSSPIRQQATTPTINYAYPMSSLSNHIIKPLNNFYSSVQRYDGNINKMNPWNRCNSQRYSNSEYEGTIAYSRTILR